MTGATSLESARRELEDNVVEHPNDRDALLALAVFLHTVPQDLDAAEAYYRRALDADPIHAATLNNLGSLVLARRRHVSAEEALALFERAIRCEPNDPRGYVNAGAVLHLARGDSVSAERMYRRALELDPDDVPALGNLAIVLAETGRVRDAEDLHRSAVSRSEVTGSVRALCDYASFLLRYRGDSSKAEELLHRARLANGADADVLSNLAALYLHGRADADAAEQFFREAIDADPTHALALAGMGVLALRKAVTARQAPVKSGAGIMDRLAVQAEEQSKRGSVADSDGSVPSAAAAGRSKSSAHSAATAAGPGRGASAVEHRSPAHQALALIISDPETGGPYRSDYVSCAEQLFEEALRHDPHNLDALAHFAGLVHTRRRDYVRAGEMFDHALELAPRNADLLNNAAVLRVDMKQRDSAEFLFLRALDVDPSHVEAATNFANLLVDKGDVDGAETLFRRALGEAAAASAAQCRVLSAYGAFALEVRKDAARAEELFARASESSAADASLLANYGAVLLRRARRSAEARERADVFANAKKCLERAIAMDPQHAVAHCYLGHYHWHHRRSHAKARELYARALALDPALTEAAFSLGALMHDLNEPDTEVEPVYKVVLRLDPNHTETLMRYAMLIQSWRGDTERAESFFRRAQLSSPNSSDVHCNHGAFVYETKEDIERALELTTRAVELDGTNYWALANLAYLSREAGSELGEVQRLYERAIASAERQGQPQPSILCHFATFLYQYCSIIDRADDLFEQALRLDSDHVETLQNYSVFLREARKNTVRANTLYQRALKLRAPTSKRRAESAKPPIALNPLSVPAEPSVLSQQRMFSSPASSTASSGAAAGAPRRPAGSVRPHPLSVSSTANDDGDAVAPVPPPGQNPGNPRTPRAIQQQQGQIQGQIQGQSPSQGQVEGQEQLQRQFEEQQRMIQDQLEQLRSQQQQLQEMQSKMLRGQGLGQGQEEDDPHGAHEPHQQEQSEEAKRDARHSSKALPSALRGDADAGGGRSDGQKSPRVSFQEASSGKVSAVTTIPHRFNRGRRKSVSAEVLSQSASAAQKVRFISKPADAVARITQAIAGNLLFSHLDQSQKFEVTGAMEERKVKAGEVVIEQGADGDDFFVVEEGTFRVTVTSGGVAKEVGEISKGGSFGELALMYNTPRAATIEAASDGVLWALDRISFRSILLINMLNRRRKAESFLKKVPLLQDMTNYERGVVADVLEYTTYQPGDVIVRQGEHGDAFYLVEEGRVEVTRQESPDSPENVVGTIEESGYFGEIALLTSAPRAATVTALTEVKVGSLGRSAFRRLLGPVLGLLKRNAAAKYGTDGTKIEVDGVTYHVDGEGTLNPERGGDTAGVGDAETAPVINITGDDGGSAAGADGIVGDVVLPSAARAGGYAGDFADDDGNGNGDDDDDGDGRSDRSSRASESDSMDFNDGSSDILSNASSFASEDSYDSHYERTHVRPKVLAESQSSSRILELSIPGGKPARGVSGGVGGDLGSIDEAGDVAPGPPAPRSEPVAQRDDPLLEKFRSSHLYKKRRNAVSAEVMRGRNGGASGGRGGKPVMVAKSVDARLRLNEVLKRLRKRSWLFASLGDEQRKEVIDAMAEVRKSRGDVVIQQGDDGDKFYVIEAGECEVSVKRADGTETVMGSLGSNSTFGELALMYFAPRAATVTCLRSTVMWALDRQTFRRVIQHAALAKRREHEEFLKKIPLLQSATEYERGSLADNLFQLSYEPGTYVCRQGEVGDRFYIIAEGKALVTQAPSRHVTPVLVKHLNVGDYFGELALLSATSRRVANVVAAGDSPLRVLYMDRASFTRLVGPSERILRRNMEAYRQYHEVIEDHTAMERPVPFVPMDENGHGESPRVQRRQVNTGGATGGSGGVGGGGGGGSGAGSSPLANGGRSDSGSVPSLVSSARVGSGYVGGSAIAASGEVLPSLVSAMSNNLIFESLPAALKRELYQRSRRVVVPPGQQIAKAGEMPKRVLLLASGTCAVDEDGFPSIAQPGTAIGAAEMLSDSALSATFTVSDQREAELFDIDAEIFNKMIAGPTRLRRERALPVLTDIIVFSSLTGPDRALVASVLHEKVYRRGDTIVKQESAPDHLYFIVSGTVTIERREADGAATLSVDLNEGTYFGERSFLRDEKRAASVIAATDSVTCLCLKGSLFKLLPAAVVGLLRLNIPDLSK